MTRRRPRLVGQAVAATRKDEIINAGKSTSKAEIQDITRNGVWLFARGREYLLTFKDYPWFKDAPVSAVYNVRLMHQSHLFWPDLDVDLDIASLENPERYPLVAKRGA